MKVIHLIGGDLNGGAAKGAYCLHQGLMEIGVDSYVLTNSKDTLNDPRVKSVNRTKKQKFANIACAQFDQLPVYLYPKREKVLFSTSLIGYDFTKHPLYKLADIIHLHWICGGYISIRYLSKINKPIIWTMRDMWPMTGGCHYAMECEKYKTGCGNCDQLKSNRSYDLSKFILNRKKKYLPKSMKLVGISHWLSERAKESELFRDFDVRTIANNIDTNEFFPVEKKVARDILGIKTDKKIILVGSTNLKDFYKGFGKFQEAVKELNKSKYFCVFFGNIDKSVAEDLRFEYKSFGYLYDNISLRLVYSGADVFVAPSLMEAFGKTLAESMACGTPVVCFDATGPKDIVDHKENGYKAKPFSTNDLAKGIDWVLDNPDYEKLRQNARQKVLREFEMTKVAGKYKKLYEDILDR